MMTMLQLRERRREALAEAFRIGKEHPEGPFLLKADKDSLEKLDEIVKTYRKEDPQKDTASLGILLGEIFVHEDNYTWVIEDDSCYVKNRLGIYVDPIGEIRKFVSGESLLTPSEYYREEVLKERLGKLNFH